MNKIAIYCLIILSACTNNDNPPPSPMENVSQERLLKDAMAQHPDSLLLLENLVQYYRENGNYDEAITTINNAVNKDSINPRLWDIKATLHYEDGDTLNAIRSFEKAIEITPEPAIIISLGALYAQVRNPKALDMADALLISNQSKAGKEAFFIKGLYYTSVNEKQKAISFFDKALELNYTFMDAYREKALALYDQKKYKDALAVLDKAVTLQNNFEEGHFYRGRCLEKLNRVQDAIEAYQMALLYDPGYIEAREALAKLGIKN